MKVRRATAKDIDAFAELEQTPTVIGWVGELDGKIIAVGGLARTAGYWSAFCDLTEEAKPYKYKIARTALRVMKDARARGIHYVYANLDSTKEGSQKWAESLGFELDPRSQKLFRWRIK